MRYTPACSDFERSPNFASYQRECTGTSLYSVCGCLRSKDCFSEDPLFTELSCSGSRPTPATPPTPESRPESRPAPICGNGVVEGIEECEPPLTGNCNEVCKWSESKCGDGRVDIGRGEECEPPSTNHGDWECNELCKVKKIPPAPKCGDGALNQTWEECEPAGTATCDANCKRIRFCGDGMVDTDLGEQCERPNTTGCDAHCQKIPNTSQTETPRCGDGIVQTDRGEECERPGVGNCNRDCKIVNPSTTPLVQAYFLEGSGRCSLNFFASQGVNTSQYFTLLFSIFALSGLKYIKRKK